MGKYAPNPKCANCKALKELCVSCATDWKFKQFDDEITVLRELATELRGRSKGCANVPITKLLKKHEKIVLREPLLKRKR